MADGPKCPKPPRLRELIEAVGESNLSQKDEVDLVDALDWLATSLSNRALYHKKQQIKNKIVFRLASEHGLTDEVEKLAESALHNHVSESDEMPSMSDLEEFFTDEQK